MSYHGMGFATTSLNIATQPTTQKRLVSSTSPLMNLSYRAPAPAPSPLALLTRAPTPPPSTPPPSEGESMVITSDAPAEDEMVSPEEMAETYMAYPSDGGEIDIAEEASVVSEKKFPWWIVIVAAAGLGGGAWWMMRKK